MGRYDSIEGIAARTMNLFFIADTSYSMEGSKIGAMNEAINNVIPEVRSISDDSADAEIKIAALKFSTGAEWIYPAPVAAADFNWTYLEADGMTEFGVACNMLRDKLSTKTGFMNAAAGSYAPAIFLFSDGAPSDNYEDSLILLKGNNWFKHAIKIAVAIGDDANMDILAEFTGNREAVVTVHTPEALKRLIRFIVVTSSQVGSKPQDAGVPMTKQDTVVEQMQEFVAEQLDDSEDDEW
ncbi:MAG: hypothetical protein FWC13_11005 [Oscillospiraceae bacterium]|nr:hypothetical protein [Oscillospiraceae bacterium]